MADAVQYFNKDNLHIFPKEIADSINNLKQWLPLNNIDYKHEKITSIILDDFKKKNTLALSENITRAGSVRGFLG